MNRKENNMDAVKFLGEYQRMCSRHRCKDCPVKKVTNLCLYNGDYSEKMPQEELERAVEIVENWSKENPEEIGKKYIIEIDAVDKDYKGYHTNIGWLSKSQLEQLEEYKESEE